MQVCRGPFTLRCNAAFIEANEKDRLPRFVTGVSFARPHDSLMLEFTNAGARNEPRVTLAV